MERGAHAGADLLAGLVTPWGTRTGAACENFVCLLSGFESYLNNY